MGRNQEIKRFDPRKGKTVDLFTAGRGRLPVLMELLASPWVTRASELARPGDAPAGKRVERPVDVEWHGERGRPGAFRLRGTRYPIDAVVSEWRVERRWWDRGCRVSRRCFRVMARGGVYDLAYDRLADSWLLVGILD